MRISSIRYIIIFVLFILPLAGHSEESFSISGEIIFRHDAPIYVSVYNYEGFSEFKQKLPLEQFYKLIKPSRDQISDGKIKFKFNSIPKGTYCIFAFQDLDSDGKVKSSVYGYIDEPYEFYREYIVGLPSWERVSFELSGDLKGIVLKLHN